MEIYRDLPFAIAPGRNMKNFYKFHERSEYISPSASEAYFVRLWRTSFLNYMSKIIKFEIVTPERVVLKAEVKRVTLPTQQGEITVLAGHIPLVAILQPGVIEIEKKDGEAEIISVSGGFIEVLRDKIVILADTAERAEEIDLERAEAARKRAEQTIKEMRQFDQARFANVNAQIAKELARSRAVKRWKKIKNIG